MIGEAAAAVEIEEVQVAVAEVADPEEVVVVVKEVVVGQEGKDNRYWILDIGYWLKEQRVIRNQK